jgi:hypothetical protein
MGGLFNPGYVGMEGKITGFLGIYLQTLEFAVDSYKHPGACGARVLALFS